MMKNLNSLDRYTNQTEILVRFNQANPTLAHKRKSLAAPHRGIKFASVETVESFEGKTAHFAGMTFLADIHAEIDAANPTRRELEELETLNAQKRQEAIELASALGLMNQPQVELAQAA